MILLTLLTMAVEAPEYEKVLGWLPDETQTLVVAAKPFTLPPVAGEDGDWERDGSLVDVLRDIAIGDLPAVFAGRRVQFAATGICAFEQMRGIGIGRVKSATVIRFDGEIGAVWESIATGKSGVTISGLGMRSFSKIRSGSLREHPEEVNVSMVQVAPDMLILATDVSILETVLARRANSRKARLGELPEWRWVNLEAPVFALRHQQNEAMVVNPASTGFRETVFYLSTDPDGIRARWAETEGELLLNFRAREQGAITVEATAPSRDGQTGLTLWLLMELGFEIGI